MIGIFIPKKNSQKADIVPVLDTVFLALGAQDKYQGPSTMISVL